MGLTEKAVRDLKPGPKTTFLWDDRVSGKGRLGVRVTSAGAKAYVLDYFDAGGTRRRMTLGRPAEMSLAQARDRASRELAAIRDGRPDMAERRRQAIEAPTVADLIDQFLMVEGPARIKRGRMSERTLTEYRRQSKAYVLPAIGAKRVVDVKRGDIEKMVAPLPSTTRNRVLAYTSRLMTLAEVWEMRPAGSNPVRKIERAREEARDRVLSPSELSDLAGALRELEDRHPAPVAAIRFAAVTGLRISEVLGIQWQHVDFENGQLRLLSTKTGRRLHDLPAPAIEILTSITRREFEPWAFSSTGAAPVGYKTARAVFARAAKRAGLADVRLHDLRRGVMSAAAASGANVAVLQRLLGHRTPQMALRYVNEIRDPVQATRERVASQMAAAMSCDESAKVIPMERRRGH